MLSLGQRDYVAQRRTPNNTPSQSYGSIGVYITAPGANTMTYSRSARKIQFETGPWTRTGYTDTAGEMSHQGGGLDRV
jgi:hypothetical protein